MRLAANERRDEQRHPEDCQRRPRRWCVALGIPGPYVTERLGSASAMSRATAVPDASATAAAIRIRLPFIRRSSHEGSFEETDRSPSNGSVWFRRFFTPLG
jgi:hypothetical protein